MKTKKKQKKFRKNEEKKLCASPESGIAMTKSPVQKFDSNKQRS